MATGIFQAQYYQSEESLKGPYAVTPDERLWGRDSPPTDYKRALAQAKTWSEASGNAFKSCRVVELDEEGNPISVAWASAWEAPIKDKPEQGTSGIPGVSCKLLVWEDRDNGPPDHWDWVQMLHFLNSNSWDYEYGREVATRGRMTCYSIKLNLWPHGKLKPPHKWDWHKILGKDPETQQDEVEFVRSHEIGPREFPPGSETVDCAYCGKTHLRSKTWVSYNADRDETAFYDRCRCVDDVVGEDEWRMDPDGEEFDEGCLVKLGIEA